MIHQDDIARLEDAHLDTMIRLAFQLEAAEETARLLEESDPAIPPEDAALADRMLLSALDRMEAQSRSTRRERMLHTARRIIPRLVNIAACIILILALATPVALANSATFRSRVMELLVEFDHEKGEAYFSFVPNETEAFNVPEGWPGHYFPSYIPQGFTIYDFDPAFPLASIQFRNAASNQLFFDEYTEDTDMMIGTENTTISTVDINGSSACLIEGPAADGVTWSVSIIWQNDTNWFDVTGFGISTEEAIAVARSVRQIVK